MAYTIYLSVGDFGVNAVDSLSLTDGNPIGVLLGTLKAPAPALSADERVIELDLLVQAASEDAIMAGLRNIEAKLWQARLGYGPDGVGLPVSLGIQLGTTSMVYADVRWGTLAYDGAALTYLASHMVQGAHLTLHCEPLLHGVPVLYAATGTLTNGVGATTFFANIPGDEDPLTRVWLTDCSVLSGGIPTVINRVHLARRAMQGTAGQAGMASGDFSGPLDLAAYGAGANTTDTSSYTGSGFSRIASQVNTWQDIATVTQPTGAPRTIGPIDWYLRLRDASIALGQPTVTSATPATPALGAHGSTDNAAAGTSVAATWSGATAPGSLLLLQLVNDGTTSVTPTVPTGWTALVAQNPSSTQAGQWSYYQTNATGQSGSVTVTVSTSCVLSLQLLEIQNVTPGAGVIVGNGQGSTQPGIGTSTSPVSVGSVTATDTYQTMIGLWAVSPKTLGNTVTLAGTGTTTVAAQAWNPNSAAGYAHGVTLRDIGNVGSGNFAAAVAWSSASTQVYYLGQNILVDSGSLARSTNYSITAEAVDGSGNTSAAASKLVASTTTYKNLRATVTAGTGTWDHYRSFIATVGGTWYSNDQAASAATFPLGGLAGSTTTLPASQSSPGPAKFRLAACLLSGTTRFSGPEITPKKSNGIWEDCYGGTFTMPPIAALDGALPPRWRLIVQGMHPVNAGVNLDVDLVSPMPAGEAQSIGTAVDNTGASGTLTTPRVWLFDANRARHSHSCTLYGNPITLTPTGNEITDATRQTALSGDGRAYPDSSVGIWPGTTNLCGNGGFENGTGGWTATAGATLSQDTAQLKFGAHSLKIVTTATAGDGATTTTGASGMAATAATTYTASVWQYGAANLTLKVAWYNGAALLSSSTQTFTGTAAWARQSLSATAPASTTNAALQVVTQTGTIVTYWLDGAQLEAQPVATPWVTSNGALTTSVARAAAGVQVPVSTTAVATGWAVARVRPGWAAAGAAPDSFPKVWYAAMGLEFGWDAGAALWYAGNVDVHAATAGFTNAGDRVTVASAWNGSTIQIAAGSTTWTSATRSITNPTLGATVWLGDRGDGARCLGGDLLWFLCGTGTLTAADLTALMGQGDTDPNPLILSSGAAVTCAWAATRTDDAMDASEAGQVVPTGPFTLGPGENQVNVRVAVGGLASDVTAARFTVQVQATPRYRFLTGTA